MNLQREKEKIDRLVYDISFQYLNDLDIRSKYMLEERRVTSYFLDEYRYGKLDFGRAMDRLREYHMSLTNHHMNLRMGSVKLYAIAERERERHSTLTITLKRVGFISGSMQVIGGFGLCKASLGAACKSYGVPLMMQGSENVWENGYYLLYHEDPKRMPLRYAYRQVAKLLGSDDKGVILLFQREILFFHLVQPQR